MVKVMRRLQQTSRLQTAKYNNMKKKIYILVGIETGSKNKTTFVAKLAYRLIEIVLITRLRLSVHPGS